MDYNIYRISDSIYSTPSIFDSNIFSSKTLLPYSKNMNSISGQIISPNVNIINGIPIKSKYIELVKRRLFSNN